MASTPTESDDQIEAGRVWVDLNQVPDGTVVSATQPLGDPQFWLNSQTGDLNKWRG